MTMTLQLISVRLMLSNSHFFLGASLSGINNILKFEILHIQFSETIYSKKLDQTPVPYTIFTIHLRLNYLLD